MAVLSERPKIEVSINLLLTEDEARAFDALIGYGIDGFLEVFYKHMGKVYLQPYEKGLRSLFEGIRGSLEGVLNRAQDARRVFDGEKIACYRPPGYKPEEKVSKEPI